MADRKTLTIHITRDYSRFMLNPGANRELKVKKHKRLAASMQKYGFLAVFPIVVYRHPATGLLQIEDGQHRFTFAQTYNLPVAYVETDVRLNIAEINCTSENWKIEDFAETHALAGHPQYQEGLDFAEKFKLPIGTAFALLGGTTSFSNIEHDYKMGSYEIKDREWADRVGLLFSQMVALSRELNRGAFVRACMAIARVPEFDPQRLIHNAGQLRNRLVALPDYHAFLDLLDEIYNYRTRKIVALKAAAVQAMRERKRAKPVEVAA